jgi:hypothetical protein
MSQFRKIGSNFPSTLRLHVTHRDSSGFSFMLQSLKHLEILLRYVYDLELFGGPDDGYSKYFS